MRTDSADEEALLLLADGELVAILVELADDCHGDDQGKWMIEKLFGLGSVRVPNIFSTAASAARWVSDHICGLPFSLGQEIKGLAERA